MKMEIKLLPKSVRETLRSEVNIRSIPKAIAQLVFNSLEAKAASVAIRVNLITYKIQVIDNGIGISKENLKLIGYRYATSKYYSIEDLKQNPYVILSRGESLSSIIKLSQTVKIISRCSDNSKTYCKTFENGKSLKTFLVKPRPSQGTTVIIDNFIYNLPVRKKNINQNTCLDEIKSEIERIALIHPKVSFSLRNDTNSEIIFHTYRTKFVFQTVAILYGKEFSKRLRKLCHNEGDLSLNGLISLDSHVQNRIQFVYINNRYVAKTKIYEIVNKLITKSKIIKNIEATNDSSVVKQKYAAFIVNMKCPHSEIDIVDYIEPRIEFKNWKNVQLCIENGMKQFLNKYNLMETRKAENNFQNGSPLIESLPKIRTSQKAGVIRGIPMKRKISNSREFEQTPSGNENNKITIVSVDNHTPPKQFCTESVIQELSLCLKKDLNQNETKQFLSASKSENISENGREIVPLETKNYRESKPIPIGINKQEIKQPNLNKTLESNSECGRSLILNKFLKSTMIYKGDEDLKRELLKFKDTEDDKSNYLLSNSENCRTIITTATRISYSKTIEHHEKMSYNAEDNLFKVPDAPAPKTLKRKKTIRSDSTDISEILAKDRAINVINEQKISREVFLPDSFALNLKKNNFGLNCNKSKDLPPTVVDYFSKMIRDITKNRQNKNYECTVRVTKKEQYFRSSDFLQPAQNLTRKFPSIMQPERHKEKVLINSMLKPYSDIKSNNHFREPHMNYFKLGNKSNINHNHFASVEYEKKYQPFSTSFRRDNLTSHNNQNNYSPFLFRTNYKNNYYNQRTVEGSDLQQNYRNFSSPVISFKPFKINPNLRKICPENNDTSKHNLNFIIKDPLKKRFRGEKNDLKSQSGIMPTFESHNYAKKRKNKPKYESNVLPNDSENLISKAKNFANEQYYKQLDKINKNKTHEIPNTELKVLSPFLSMDKEIIKNPKENSGNKITNSSESQSFTNNEQKKSFFNFLPMNNIIIYNQEDKNQNNDIESEIVLNSTEFVCSSANTLQNSNAVNKNESFQSLPFSLYYNCDKSETKIRNTDKLSNSKKPKKNNDNMDKIELAIKSNDSKNVPKKTASSSKKILSLPEKSDTQIKQNNHNIVENSQRQKDKDETNDQSIVFVSNSSSIITSSSKNNAKPNEKQFVKLASQKDSDISSIFSSSSHLIEGKKISNIIDELDRSILNDTFTKFQTNLLKENLNKSKLQNNKKALDSLSETDCQGPVFVEDTSSIIIDNYRTIDEILNSPLNNGDINEHNDISKIEENNPKTHENENPNDNSLSKNKKSDELSQRVTKTVENENKISEWMKKTSETGNYYLNLRTGMTLYETPKSIDDCIITRRHSFMPKGMSPIMLDTSNVVTKELSPKSKNVLHQTIANLENDDLQIVKWMNYFQNKDSKQFFNSLYCDSKNYESEILDLNNYKLSKNIMTAFENYSFTKEDCDNITIINQCDDKFIVAKIEVQHKYNLLVLFDQHAVHERICLEKLMKDYEETENRLKSVKCKSSIKLTLNGFEVRMLKNYEQNFENWGFIYNIKDEDVTFTHIPLCWQMKDDSNVKNKEYASLESLLITLLQEESSWLRNIRKINVAYPICIQNTIKSEACRNAIKFGDSLSKEQCEDLIKSLFLCDLPFNCAHGRPTLYPIVDLNHLQNDNEIEEIDLSKLHKHT